MNIRIARNGTEIAIVQSIEMLRHVVAGRSVLIDDYAYVEGSVDWILVSELLKKQPETDGRIVAVDTAEVTTRPASDSPLAGVIRPAPAGRANEKSAPKRNSGYVLPTLFVGLAVLMVPLVWFLKDKPVGPRVPSGSPSNVRQAADYINEADSLYAKATEKWNDDEELIKQALRRYENAWQLIHGGFAYPEGELVATDQDVELISDDLRDKIKLCRNQTDWLPLPW